MRQIAAEKNIFKEMKRGGMAWTGKSHLDVSLCEWASFRSPEKNWNRKKGDITN